MADPSARAGMASIRTLYKIGRGPSSSHTMGPERAARGMKRDFPQADRFEVVLFGSLAKTGPGHGTDRIVRETLAPVRTQIRFDPDTQTPHPNTLRLLAYRQDALLGQREVYSIGGGEIQVKGDPLEAETMVYPHRSFAQIAAYCRENRLQLWQYVQKMEGEAVWSALRGVWRQMNAAVDEGLAASGELPGGLQVQRKAQHLYAQHHIDETRETRENRLVCAYAFAVSEQNAAGGVIVTAPTCGSCGVLPAVLRYTQEKRGFSEEEVLHALAAAGVIGNLIRTNASVSGAAGGCQAELGCACAMAAAALGQLYQMRLHQIEYAAEVAIEHHLGLTCDPIRGLVQIPCIERNAVAAMRAIQAVNLANFLSDTRKISFDLIVETMYETGRDLSGRYRETSEGGLAKLYP